MRLLVYVKIKNHYVYQQIVVIDDLLISKDTRYTFAHYLRN